MIKYALRCADGHAFESWFASAAAFDTLAETGRLACAVCGGPGVTKAMMAPNVGGGAEPGAGDADTGGDGADHASAAERPLSRPASEEEAALAAIRRRVEATAEDVGRAFAAEARAIHEGRAPERAIRGLARPAEACALAADGVPVLPLPGPPVRRLS